MACAFSEMLRNSPEGRSCFGRGPQGHGAIPGERKQKPFGLICQCEIPAPESCGERGFSVNLLPKHPAKGKGELGVTLSSQCTKLILEADHKVREYIIQLEPPGLDFCHLKKSQKFER